MHVRGRMQTRRHTIGGYAGIGRSCTQVHYLRLPAPPHRRMPFMHFGLASNLLRTVKRTLNMKTLTYWSAALTMVAAAILAGCSQTVKSPDVSANIRTALDQAGLKKVSIDQDRDKGVVTLGGHVASDGDKAQAEAIAKSIAGGQVVSDQIAVVPVGAESDARTMNSDLDKGIEQNLDAALIPEQAARWREVCGQERRRHVDWRGRLPIQAPGRPKGSRLPFRTFSRW